MANHLLNRAWRVQIRPACKMVLVHLADRASADGHCFPSHADTKRRTRLSRRHIQRCIVELELAGHITIVSRPGRCNVYKVHPRPLGTGGRLTPAAPSHLTGVSQPPEGRLPNAQTSIDPDKPRLPRPDFSIESNIHFLENTNQHQRANELRNYLRERTCGACSDQAAPYQDAGTHTQEEANCSPEDQR